MIAQFGDAMARMAALIAEQAELLGALASRFAMEFAIKGPELAYGAAGGAAAGVAFALADGERDLRDLALSGVVGGLVEGGRLGRRGGTGRPNAVDLVDKEWRESLLPAQAEKQSHWDKVAADLALPANHGSIGQSLTARTARAMEERMPGRLLYVDRQVINRDSPVLNALTDIDLETDRLVIQVKSGRSDGLSTQMKKSRLVTGKMVVALAPEMNDSTLTRYHREGLLVFRSVDSLLDYLKSIE
jgi:hypothetical protein